MTLSMFVKNYMTSSKIKKMRKKKKMKSKWVCQVLKRVNLRRAKVKLLSLVMRKAMTLVKVMVNLMVKMNLTKSLLVLKLQMMKLLKAMRLGLKILKENVKMIFLKNLLRSNMREVVSQNTQAA